MNWEDKCCMSLNLQHRITFRGLLDFATCALLLPHPTDIHLPLFFLFFLASFWHAIWMAGFSSFLRCHGMEPKWIVTGQLTRVLRFRFLCRVKFFAWDSQFGRIFGVADCQIGALSYAPVIYLQILLAVGSCDGNVVWYLCSFTRSENYHPAKAFRFCFTSSLCFQDSVWKLFWRSPVCWTLWSIIPFGFPGSVAAYCISVFGEAKCFRCEVWNPDHAL